MAGKRGHGEGSIYKRADGRWMGAVTTEGGKRRYVSGRTRREVAQKLDELRRQVAASLPVPPARLTLGQFVADWLESTIRPKRRLNTYRTYLSIFRNHIEPALGRVALARLTPRQVDQFTGEKLDGGLAPATVALMRHILVSSLRYAESYEIVARNVARLSDPISLPEPRRRPLWPEELPAFFEAVAGHPLETLYLVSLAAGLRIGEALGLCWENLDLEGQAIRVECQLDRIDGHYVLTDPKRHASRRTVALPLFAADALRQHRIRQETARLSATDWQDTLVYRDRPLHLVFLSWRGHPFHEGTVRTALARACHARGLPILRPHDLRRTYGTLLNAVKTDPKTIQELMGHANVATTFDYAQGLAEAKVEAARQLDRLAGR